MLLNKAIQFGWIVLEGEEYIGIASDGCRVGMGRVGQEDEIEIYLCDRPTPDYW